jgi:hypothetical protein
MAQVIEPLPTALNSNPSTPYLPKNEFTTSEELEACE